MYCSPYWKLFADDTKLIANIKKYNDLVLLQNDIDQLVQSANTWQMSFNEENCKAITFGVCRQNVNDTTFIEDNDTIGRLEFKVW